MLKRNLVLAAVVLFGLFLAGCQSKTEKAPREAVKPPAVKDVILATTTSTQDSGLLEVLIPDFEKKTGYKVKPIAVGTGQALKMGEKGEADVLLTHAMSAEKPLVDSGVAVNYKLIMHNDFVVIGPENDPAGVKQAKDSAEASKKIAEKGSVYISRGDDSGTHKQELSIWKVAGINPKGMKWYQETGSGMGQTLNVANEKQGYTLTDRATYLAQKKNLKLVIVAQGDKALLNIYHVMQVNPEKFPKVNGAGAKAFVEYLVSPETQKIISQFGRDKYGESLFYPDAGKKAEELGKK
ncbi:MAG: tungsten ABC transporter substrate-binding protein [Peptococcaceae bacterium BRH_c4a]|nr:MAG: tungsten ABC transporter substrate-binding protein [Peptococcaceae bacterium BRH_c4a]